jgi:DNA replication protein DnaC
VWSFWLRNGNYQIPKEKEFSEIIIPTQESQRQKFILHQIVNAGYHALFFGKTGTGKTYITKDFLLNFLIEKLPHFVISFTSFSANTSVTEA